jgi:predicted RNase H-like HicB family nuclease
MTPRPEDYLIIIEGDGSTNYGGCVSTGDTVEECERNMREAIAFHIEGLQLGGWPVPEPKLPPGTQRAAA